MAWKDTKVAFEPWVGVNYKLGIAGKKVLVLGESHYHDCEKDENCKNKANRNARHRNLTTGVVDSWKDKPHRSPVSHRVPQLFAIEKAEFWSRVAFYNYLQTFAGARPRHSPADVNWNDSDSAEAFQSVLDCLQPDRVLVLGKNTWTNLPIDPNILSSSPIPEERIKLQNSRVTWYGDDSIAYWYASRSGKLALAMPIMHPSAPGFSPEGWIPSVSLWLNLPPRPSE